MASGGLFEVVHDDISSYSAPVSVMGAKFPKRVAIALAIACGAALVYTFVAIFLFGGSVQDCFGVYVVLAFGAYWLGTRYHKGLKPEIYLTNALPRKMFGQRLVRVSPSIESGEHTKLNERIVRDREYKKATAKRGKEAPEIYLVRCEEERERSQEES